MMATTFRVASGEVIAVLNRAMRDYHPSLVKYEVKVGVLMAFSSTGWPLKHAGYPAAALVKIVPLADRVTKGYDAEIRIDQLQWDEMREQHRIALIDHELCHLKLCFDEYGQIETDDLNRPKLRTRKGDWHGSDGFAEVVERHGEYAAEAMSSCQVQAKVKGALRKRATLFDGIDPAA